MTAMPAILAMFWHAMPPELNTARLMAGAGEAPMLQAAAGWEALAIFLETQADELAGSLAALTSTWRARQASGPSRRPCRWWSGYAPRRCRRRSGRCRRRAGELVHGGDGDHATDAGDRDEPRHPRGAGGHQLPRRQHRADRGQRGRLLHPDVEPGGRRDGRLPGGDRGEHPVRADPADDADRHPGGRRGDGRRGASGRSRRMAPGAALREAAFAHVGAQATVESAGLQTGTRCGAGQHGRRRGRRPGAEGPERAQQVSGSRTSRSRARSRACRWACRWRPSWGRRSASFRSRPARWSCSRCSS